MTIREVIYCVDVVVKVNMDTKEVIRVNVDNEDIRLHPNEDYGSEVVQLTENAHWPTWEIGF